MMKGALSCSKRWLIWWASFAVEALLFAAMYMYCIYVLFRYACTSLLPLIHSSAAALHDGYC